MNRTASAVWQGSLKEGSGNLTTQSGVFEKQPYSFKTRFGDENGTNPEELIAAAHAGCFSMALSLFLNNAGLTPERIDTKANLTMVQEGGGFSITAIHLDVSAKVPGADNAKFLEAANGAKENCPVSKVLRATITMDAKLVS
ncbi:MAG TPA: OsmC family protein [Burkholderiales bacterium]|jgi:osmotically inducible protein OsmC|nr:OsmC family protein [Burkholderiales bacterium]